MEKKDYKQKDKIKN
jgi:hypothetical protein